jgi:hypothetical protein
MKVYVVSYTHYESAWRKNDRNSWEIDKEYTENNCPEAYGILIGVYGNRKKAIKAMKAFDRSNVRHTDNELDYKLIDDRSFMSEKTENISRTVIECAYDGMMKFDGHIFVYIEEVELNKQP